MIQKENRAKTKRRNDPKIIIKPSIVLGLACKINALNHLSYSGDGGIELRTRLQDECS